MPTLLVDRDRRGWKVRVREGPDGDGDLLFVTFLDVEDRRPAFGAEGEPEPSAFVSDSDELRAIALDGHGLAGKARLRAKDAAGPALASVAVADGDADRISTNFRLKLTATTRRDANRHGDSHGLVCDA